VDHSERDEAEDNAVAKFVEADKRVLRPNDTVIVAVPEANVLLQDGLARHAPSVHIVRCAVRVRLRRGDVGMRKAYVGKPASHTLNEIERPTRFGEATLLYAMPLGDGCIRSGVHGGRRNEGCSDSEQVLKPPTTHHCARDVMRFSDRLEYHLPDRHPSPS
jgi:hypothetical protein